MDTLDALIRITCGAAEIIREVYDTQFSVEYKAPRDPVTAADHRANEYICRELARIFPAIPIVAEESDPAAFAGYRRSDRIFFVDPLDGTREFVDRNGEFVVMVGLVEGDRATVGVVHAPAQRRIWAGAIGREAFTCEEGGAREPIQVSSASALAECRVVASRSHRSPALEEVLDCLGGREVVSIGSAGLKGAEVATGRAEIYVGPGRAGKLWDACAVDAIVTAAGGRFTNALGEQFDYRSPSLENDRGILGTNALVHEAVVECVIRTAGA